MSSYSAVPNIQLNQGATITLEISVYGFDEGDPVEIFGAVSQINGAVAPFYAVKPMPYHEQGKSATITLDRIPIIKPDTPDTPDTFDATLPITVVARAADAWVTILTPGVQPLAIGTGEFQAGWNQSKVSSAVSPDA